MADFVWTGNTGQTADPDLLNARQRLAQALLLEKEGTSSDPLPTGTRGAGVWTQGLARVSKALLGGLMEGNAYNEAKTADNQQRDLLLSNPLLGGAAAAPAAPAVTPGTGRVTAALTAPAAPDHIYSNDEPSPLDPPSGADRTNAIATMLGEEKPGSPEGLGVANVIRTRAVDGGYGGNTPSAVVQSPNQFSPWNDASGRARMTRALQDPAAVAAASDQLDQAYGVGKYVSAGPNDPTEGKTHFYDPASMVPVNAVPTWAQGKDYQTIGKTRFLDDPDSSPTQQAAIPANATPTQGYAVPAAALTPAAAAPASPIPPATQTYIRQLIANPATRAAGVALMAQYAKPHDSFSQNTDQDGNVWSVNNQTGQRTVALKATEDPTSVREYNFYKSQLPAGQAAMPYDTWTTAKARAGATSISNNFDPNASQTYDKLLAEGVAKSHAGLANGVEDAQTRLQAINGMQGSMDAIQKNGGTTGGMGAEQMLNLKKTLNAGSNALGMGQPFDENTLSDQELMTKFNRQLAGAAAKNAVGSRVTNFELGNYLAANPGLAMSPTGNQRLLGIQAQVAQRDIDVGNAIRNATAAAISQGKKIDPVTVQKIITDYDEAHHVRDPVSGQDLTQSYALPDLQAPSTNSSLAIGHETNLNGIRIKRIN